jgi:hypothetical protein
MARSLTVKHDETMTVNWLFVGFLFVAVGWLVLSALTAPVAEAVPADEAALEAQP